MTSPITLRTTGLYAWYALVFLQPFSPFGALRIISMTVLLVCLVGEFRSAQQHIVNQQLAPRIAIAVALWAISVSLLGPYPLDSAHSLRKDLLVQALMLVSALVYLRTVEDVWRLIGTALAGFTTVTLFSLIEIGGYWTHNGLSLWVDRSHDMFWGGYGATGSFYIPFLVGWLLNSPKNKSCAVVGWITLFTAIFLVALYGSRTPLIVASLATLALLILLKRWQSLICAGLLALGIVAILQLAPASHLDKYKSLLRGETYVTNTGLSSRLSLWEGCWQVIAERPLTGYGYGWKKLAWAINDGQFAERWQQRPDIASYYLAGGKAAYGRVNPHNYPLQVMFEIGMIGLALVAAFWLATIRNGAILLRRSDPELRRVAACLLAALVGYGTANLTNGHWVGGQANLSLAFAGCLIALARTSGTTTRTD